MNHTIWLLLFWQEPFLSKKRCFPLRRNISSFFVLQSSLHEGSDLFCDFLAVVLHDLCNFCTGRIGSRRKLVAIASGDEANADCPFDCFFCPSGNVACVSVFADVCTLVIVAGICFQHDSQLFTGDVLVWTEGAVGITADYIGSVHR